MRPRMLLGGIALAAAIAGPAQAADDVKIGFITKFPVPFFATMEDAAKAYAAANPGVEIVFGQGTSATDIEGQIALIESMVTQGVQGIAVTPVDPRRRGAVAEARLEAPAERNVAREPLGAAGELAVRRQAVCGDCHRVGDSYASGTRRERRLEDAGPRGAERPRIRQHASARRPAGVLLDGEQGRHAAAGRVDAPQQVAGALRGDHPDVDRRRRLDAPEPDVESMGEHQ